jgi:hypothetical protein
MKDAEATQSWVRRIIDNDSKRAYKRSRVNGLVDGNPPYSRGNLLKANRAEACNVNWGIGRSYMESGVGAFYDLTSEAPGLIGCTITHGTAEERSRWSGEMMEEADKVLSGDPVWDYNLQQSQNGTVLHGCGPLFFEDAFQILPKAFMCGDLKVPEFTKSDTFYWDACTVLASYYPPELYEFIRKAEAAKKIGWDVEYTREVISNAMDVKTQEGRLYDWEFYQQELKNNSLSYYDDSKVSRIAHVFWKEFDGRITHAMVQESSQTTTPTKYLFIHVGRYASWNQCAHPMYFDRGNNGYHHSVTGLGVKMFSAMEFQNRLLCNLADKAFAPKILFKPTTTEAGQKFSMTNFSDYAVLNANWDWQQTGLSGLMNDGLAMNKEVTDMMQSNLSSYRQQVPMQESGNPPTKFQKQLEASQQSSLSKTTFNRYYKQMDSLYQEVLRRLCNLNSPNEMAKEFQRRCLKRGIPQEALGRVEEVKAIRVIGQGSPFMRKQAVMDLMTIIERLPEDGQNNWLNDFISSSAGQSAVSRYNPPKMQSKLASDQQAEALQWVSAMKTGVPPVVTSSQNAVTYAATFLHAGLQAVQSVRQGGDPKEVLQFLSLCGPAIAAHLKRFAKDPTRANIFKEMEKQWKQLAKITDKLKAIIEKRAKEQQGQQQQGQAATADMQIKAMKLKSDIAMKSAKTKAQLAQSEAKHNMKLAQARQDLAIKDAASAAEITRNRLKP